MTTSRDGLAVLKVNYHGSRLFATGGLEQLGLSHDEVFCVGAAEIYEDAFNMNKLTVRIDENPQELFTSDGQTAYPFPNKVDSYLFTSGRYLVGVSHYSQVRDGLTVPRIIGTLYERKPAAEPQEKVGKKVKESNKRKG
ncbi:MAG: hypothetical protein AABW73_02020 [Nanoarchaeota archaeon]